MQSKNQEQIYQVLKCILIAFTTASVPLLAVGYPRAKKSHQTYNQYSMGYPMTLNIQASKNGIGLALNF